MKTKISWNEMEVQENIGQTLVKLLMLKGEKGDTGTTNYNDLINKPTKLSDFTNDGVFITNAVNDLANYYLKSQTYTQTEVNNLISVIPKFAISVVNSLPTQDISTTTIYLVPSTSETTDMYKEYIYVNNAWELLGIQKADLTNYYTKTETDTLLSGKADSSTVSSLSGQVSTNTGDITAINGTLSGFVSSIGTSDSTAVDVSQGSTHNYCSVTIPANHYAIVFVGAIVEPKTTSTETEVYLGYTIANEAHWVQSAILTGAENDYYMQAPAIITSSTSARTLQAQITCAIASDFRIIYGTVNALLFKAT